MHESFDELVVLDTGRLSLFFGDDRQLLQQITEIVQMDYPVTLEKLGKALDAGNQTDATNLAHTLKGSCANIGGDKVSAVASQVNDAAKRGDLMKCKEMFPFLSHCLTEFITALQAHAKGAD